MIPSEVACQPMDLLRLGSLFRTPRVTSNCADVVALCVETLRNPC